jgi:hypothetical protein
LLDGDDVRCETGKVVDPRQRAVLFVLAAEDNGATSLDLRHRPVAETDRAADAVVELREGAPLPSHVVRGPGVENPSMGLRIRTRAELGEDAVLVNVDAAERRRRRRDGVDGSRRGRCRGRVEGDNGVGHQQGMLIFLTLGHMGLTLLGLVGAVAGPMAHLVTLEARGARRLVGVVSRPSSTAGAATAATVPRLPGLLAAGDGAATAVISTQLQLREPLLLIEKESALLVVDLVRRWRWRQPQLLLAPFLHLA